MILVRNVHQLKFGKAKDMKAIWKEGVDALEKVGRTDTRAMLDLTGPAYTLVIENEFKNLAEFEQESGKVFASSDWQAFYSKMSPLCESSYREIFTIL